MGWIYRGRSGAGEAAPCFLVSSACCSMISHLQGEEALFLLHSPLSCPPLPLHSRCTQLGPGLHSASVCAFFPSLLSAAGSAWCAGGKWLFFRSSLVPGTREVVSVLLKYSSESGYSNLLSLFLFWKVQITSLSKACSFLNSEINIAEFLTCLIVFYLSTCGFADD